MTLLNCKSYKERKGRLSESFDWLSFDFPDLYALFAKEMKRREIESNNPNRISKWLNTPHSYEKLHEALILVKNTNIMAKEEYVGCLMRMLFQTIESRTNIDKTVKICRLIETSTHLASIYDQLKDLIQRVYQINIDKTYTAVKRQPEYLGSDDFNHIIVDPLSVLKIPQCNQSQYRTVWPTMLQPSYLGPFNDFSNFNLDYYGNGRPAISNITIVDQDMDGTFAMWLHYLKLHKYQWFFCGLSYLEIECIDEENIEAFIVKVNKNSITKGAQKKICLSTKSLRDRKIKLENLLMSLDLEVTPNELCEYTTYMKDILHYPIPNKHCIVGDQLQHTITFVMEKLFTQLLEKLSTVQLLVAQSLIGSSINKFLECTMLITGNQTFMKEQVDKASDFAKQLKYQVHRMPKNFN